MTCQKARSYLATIEGEVSESENASKIRYDAKEALKILKDVKTLIAMKGKKVVTFDLKNDPPDEETLLAHLIGPTGNLRAPTARVGDILMVGFNEEAYGEVLM